MSTLKTSLVIIILNVIVKIIVIVILNMIVKILTVIIII